MNDASNCAALFHEFLGMLPGAESLDDPAVMAPSAPGQRADFLLFQRSMIAEVKRLETDPAYKVEAIIDRYKTHPSFPLFYGERTLEAVLRHLPADIQSEIRVATYDSISRAITEGCEDANRQVRDTRQHFGLAGAAGVLFILNDRIPILSPNVLAARLQQQMNKRTASGADRFPEISFACALSWAHFLRGPDGTRAHPIITLEGPAARHHPIARHQLDYIIHAWSARTTSQLKDAGKVSREVFENYELAIPNELPREIPRGEAWRRAYRQQRYLVALSMDELMKHGQEALAELRPHFMKGQKGTGDVRQLMRRWSDFMEECQLRNLDMRQFRPHGPESA